MMDDRVMMSEPISPDMRDIMQTLATRVIKARTSLTIADKQMSDYINQCRQMLGLSPDKWAFDPATASFKEVR